MTLDEERARAAGLPTQWRSHGPLASIAFFVLASVVVASMYMVFDAITAAIAIVAAEYLIRKQRFFGTGIESALWIGGLFVVIVSLPGPSRREGILLFALASAIAAVRLRQPYFGAAAVLFCIAYFKAAVLPLSIGVAIVALVAITREIRRPSLERFWETVLVVAPIMPAFWRATPGVIVPLYIALSIVLIAAAIRLRHHAPAIAAAVTATIAFIKLQDLIHVSIEPQLIALGAALLITSSLISRALRNNTRGLVTTPSKITDFDEELQTAATIALQPKAPEAPAEEPRRGEGGGNFGGAGATGDF